jgi:hypothetical protein
MVMFSFLHLPEGNSNNVQFLVVVVFGQLAQSPQNGENSPGDNESTKYRDVNHDFLHLPHCRYPRVAGFGLAFDLKLLIQNCRSILESYRWHPYAMARYGATGTSAA